MIAPIRKLEQYTDLLTPDNFKADKFKRLLLNPEAKRFLGYDFNEAACALDIDDNELFLERLKKSIDEINNENSEHLYSAQFKQRNRTAFFQSIDNKFIDQKSFNKQNKQRQTAKESGQLELMPTSAPPSKTSDTICREEVRAERSIKTPSGLFDGSLPFKIDNSNLKNMFDELKNIPVAKFPNAAHDLLRSFLECSLVEFLTEIGAYNTLIKNKKHNPKLSELLDHVIKEKIITDAHAVDCINSMRKDWSQPYSLQRMNMVNHNKNYSSTERDVRTASGNLVPLFKIILNPNKYVEHK